jgi:hypothetical protein
MFATSPAVCRLVFLSGLLGVCIDAECRTTDRIGGTRDRTKQRQFDMAAAHIIKVRHRKIHEIEATGAVLPFTSNGWSDFLR